MGERVSRPRVRGRQRGQEDLQPSGAVVAKAADNLDRLAGGVLQFLVQIALARIERTGVAAAHGGGDDVALANGVIGQWLAEGP
jgi:hypothetical protein